MNFMNFNELYCPKCGSPLFYEFSKDYYCKNETCNYSLHNPDVIDISYKSHGIAKALSNLCPYPFTFDNVECASMESFIQSLKVPNPLIQKDICSKTSIFCYNIRELWDDWNGKRIFRHSDEYIELLKKAYTCLYRQSPIFSYALNKSKPYVLMHTIGCTNPSETLLTPDEYISLLTYLKTI